jgi:hypothetical protein
MATQDPTTNYGWDLPTVSGSTNTWGTELNAILGDDATGIDAIIKAVSVIANAAMPQSGGTFTGNVTFGANCAARENAVSVTSAIDWSLGNFFYTSLGASVDWTGDWSNYPADGTVQFITIEIKQGSGGQTVTWPAEVVWQDGVAPTLSTTALAKDILVFYTRDGGVTVVGAHSITEPS